MSADRSNFAEDIEAAAGGEPIEAVVIGSVADYVSPPRAMAPHPPEELFGVPISWEEARPWLDREHDGSYGLEECWPIWAWTPTKVLVVGTYDGSTWVDAVPRHPAAGQPVMIGGG